MKKKHLAIICGIYYPEPSPTGLCAKRFSELLKDDFDIDIICISTNGINEDVKLDTGLEIHTLSGGTIGIENRSKGLVKNFFHQIGRFQIKTLLLGNLNWFEKAVIKKLSEINSAKRIDSLFSICSPFVAHTAAKKYKVANPYIHWCAYTVDPYSTNNRIRPIGKSLDYLIKIEKDTLNAADHLLLSDEVYFNRKELFLNHNCCEPLPYILPELDTFNSQNSIFSNKNINCVYAGKFYKDIRKPNSLLTVFSHFKDNRIKLYLFSNGCDDTVDSYINTNHNIIKKQQVDHSEIAKIYKEADILVLVSNTTNEFLPSKTFEYIATGKPIISFNSNETDKTVLSAYPVKYFVENEKKSEDVENFIIHSKGKNITRDEIEKIYARHLKGHVQKILISSME